jgi:hypothetical protein
MYVYIIDLEHITCQDFMDLTTSPDRCGRIENTHLSGDRVTKAQRDVNKKLRVFEYVKGIGNAAKTYRYSGMSRDAYCHWGRNHQTRGEEGLVA